MTKAPGDEQQFAAWLNEEHPPSADWKTATLPVLEEQENMPDAATAPANPAVNVPAPVDLASIQVPDKLSEEQERMMKEFAASGGLKY